VPADPATDGGALILAAGFGRRFGADKRLYLLNDHTPMLFETLRRYRAVFEQTAVVLREDDELLTERLTEAMPTVRIIPTREAHLGMGHSLAAGIDAVAADWRYACIGLGDMPHIEIESLRILLAHYLDGDRDTIVQPSFNDVPGHPVIFGSTYFSEIARSTGDAGARAVIRKHADRLLRVPLEDPGVLEDIDHPPEI